MYEPRVSIFDGHQTPDYRRFRLRSARSEAAFLSNPACRPKAEAQTEDLRALEQNPLQRVIPHLYKSLGRDDELVT